LVDWLVVCDERAVVVVLCVVADEDEALLVCNMDSFSLVYHTQFFFW
jgi:hypothetical protein